MALNQGNYYILVTESTVKLTYVRTVPEPGMFAAERDPEKGSVLTMFAELKPCF